MDLLEHTRKEILKSELAYLSKCKIYIESYDHLIQLIIDLRSKSSGYDFDIEKVQIQGKSNIIIYILTIKWNLISTTHGSPGYGLKSWIY